jgi:nitroreductase
LSKFKDAMLFRHACKRFDEDRKIPSGELETLLETIRLSPSSFGMEPWRVIVVQSASVKQALKPMCWNQAQIDSCSELLLFCCDNDAINGITPYSEAMFERRGLDTQAREKYLEVYSTYTKALDQKSGMLENWSAKQCYIAAANVMTHAASLEIDSCPIEGFEKEKIEEYLGLQNGMKLALIVALGYRLDEPPAKQRLPLNQIVTYM